LFGVAAEPLKSLASSANQPSAYTSMMLQLYLETLQEQSGELKVLDLGPVCEENIMFFAALVKRVYVCDMFIRLDRHRRPGKTSRDLLEDLDYPEQSFHGIHLWDLVDHLEDGEASRLVEVCHRLLRPRGLLTVIAYDKLPAASSPVRSFVIQSNCQVAPRPQPHLDLPWYFRSNRQLTALLAIFPRINSFLSRSGTREMLLERG
jgi:hypothetical protein